jgi:hypothetical protein
MTEQFTASARATADYAGPIWTLVLLAPLIAEVLSESTRLSFLFAFIPETMVWGCGALLCRELVCRWRAGATSLLLLGLALSVAEEFVIQQTSLAPLPFAGIHVNYGRLWGVNWLYFLFMLGYEGVWVTVVPVTITELLFPARARQTWLRVRGFLVACTVFALGSLIAWYAWVKRARPNLHAAPYRPPLGAIAAGIAAILVLGYAAYALRETGKPGSHQGAGSSALSWLAFIAAFLTGCAWFKLIGLLFTPTHTPVSVPLVLGFAGALCTYALFRALSTRGTWSERQRWAASFGATLACMAVGYLSTAGWSRRDLLFKAILNVLALFGLFALGQSVRKRTAGSATDEIRKRRRGASGDSELSEMGQFDQRSP